MVASGVMLVGNLCSSAVELNRETILINFDPNALILGGVSSGIVDA
jgi:hypothetical protein